MARFNTGNPVGSKDPRDLSDNAQNIDEWANSEDASFKDRLGVVRRTLHGMELDARPAIKEEAGTSYTYALSDENAFIQHNNSDAIAATVPPNSSAPFPIGTVITGEQTGAGAVTLTAGTGVTVNASGGDLATNGQYAQYVLLKVDTDTWRASGDLTTWSCTITLEAPGEPAPPDAQPLDISGQTAFKTLSDPTTDYFTAFSASAFTVDWEGRRAVEFNTNDLGGFGVCGLGLARTDLTVWARWDWDDSAGSWGIDDLAGAVSGIAGNPDDIVGVVMRGDGVREYWKNDVLEHTATDSWGSYEGEGFYIGVFANMQSASLPAGASMTSTVAAGKDAQSYDYDGADDWCGNQL